MPSESDQPSAKHLSYLDFELEISPSGGREYVIAVLHSPAGEAREMMRFPFDELALENRLQALQIALLRSGGRRRQVLSPEEQTVQDFGGELFGALFTGEVRSRYDMSHHQAAQQGKGLRLKLRIQPPELAALPWEFLYDARQGEYVCLSRYTPVVRYLELPQPIQPFAVTPPLRILGMVVSPRDLASLDIDREKQRVEKAIKDLRAQGLVELVWLEGQTWRDLQRAMRSGPWHIFHFIGHGGFDQNADEGLIALADEEGLTHHRLRATHLGRLLADHHSLRLILLNACEGARGSERDIFSSTAAILVRRGLPAVLAMQYEITDRAAIEFARAFYEALADEMPVDAAVAEARKAISLEVADTVEWGTPVLYMRSPDGILFHLTQTPAIPPQQPVALPRSEAAQVPEAAAEQILLAPEPKAAPSITPPTHPVPVPNPAAPEPASACSLRVFLCHSSGDKPAVRTLCQRLQADGVEPWLDEENLLPGQDWQQEIPQAVRASDVIIVCLSRGSVNKEGYLQREIKYALDVAEEKPEGTIFIIPLKLEECEIPERLRRWQWVNSLEEKGYERLLRSLRARANTLGTTLKPRSQPAPLTSEAARQRMEKAREAAEQVDARERLPAAFAQAQHLAVQGQEHEGREEFDQAVGFYEQAEQQFMQLARQAALQAARDGAEAARQQMREVKERVSALREWAESLWAEAQEQEAGAEQAYQAQDYEQAVAGYEQTRQAYERVREAGERERLRQDALQTRQVAEAAREKVEEAKKGLEALTQWTGAKWAAAQEQETEAERAWQAQDYRRAAERYEQACQSYTEARGEAEEARLRQHALEANQQAEQGRTAAKRAEAQMYAPELYQRAKEARGRGERSLAAKRWEAAAKEFVQAQELFAQAIESGQSEKAKQAAVAVPQSTEDSGQVHSPGALPKEIGISIGMKFVLIPAGEFLMGSTDGRDDERPVHKVRISQPFYLGKYAVTQAQWEAVMRSNPSQSKRDPNRPVEAVSWEAVQEFIRKLDAREGGAPHYRLPTEAEWEYACRAGSTTAYSFEDGILFSRLGEYAWYGKNADKQTHPVGQLKPNAWGLYDMHGNVWEWVQDWFGEYPAKAVIDPQGPSAGSARVVRGGSWGSDAENCRSARRTDGAPGDRDGGLGFRLLRTAR